MPNNNKFDIKCLITTTVFYICYCEIPLVKVYPFGFLVLEWQRVKFFGKSLLFPIGEIYSVLLVIVSEKKSEGESKILEMSLEEVRVNVLKWTLVPEIAIYKLHFFRRFLSM